MYRFIYTFLLILLFVSSVTSFYEGSSPVQSLTAKDFSKTRKGLWLVEFYAPWCGHCQSLAPEYQKAAKALAGIANIAAVDATQHQTGINIQGYPTIKFFVDGKETEYQGQRTAEAIVNFVLDQFKRTAFSRLGSSSGGSSSHSSGGSGDFDQKDVVILEESNFDSLVLGDNGPWFVEFYAPWCGHCKNLAPEWAQLATDLKGQIKVGKVDATVHKDLAARFGVSGYPTIKFFPAGKKTDDSVIAYEGARSASAIAEWGRENSGDSKSFNLVHLDSQNTYDEYCKGRNVCVISFLPHILDSSQEERENYLQTIKQVGRRFRGKPFTFLWSQGSDQYDFETIFGVEGTGYPSVIAISNNKRLYSRMRKSFAQENFENFVQEIIDNKGKFIKLQKEPNNIKTVPTVDTSNTSDSEL